MSLGDLPIFDLVQVCWNASVLLSDCRPYAIDVITSRNQM